MTSHNHPHPPQASCHCVVCKPLERPCDCEGCRAVKPVPPETDKKLTYRDLDGARREVRGCTLTVDKFDRHWIWSEQLQHNLVYKTKGREDALLAAIDGLLFTIQLKDERIAGLQRIADLAPTRPVWGGGVMGCALLLHFATLPPVPGLAPVEFSVSSKF